METLIHCLEFTEQEPTEEGSKFVSYIEKIGHNSFWGRRSYFIVNSDNCIIQYFSYILKPDVREVVEGSGYKYNLIDQNSHDEEQK
jgi:hypothetical protein